MITSVGALTNTLMDPLGDPAGTMAASATTFPWNEFNHRAFACRPRPKGSQVVFDGYCRSEISLLLPGGREITRGLFVFELL